MKKLKSYGITLFILVLIFVSLYSYFILGNQLRSERGITTGREYVAKMYGDYTKVGENCQGEDTNSDGYVTCNFRVKQVNGVIEKTITLQCPTFIKSFLATSCKEQGIVINNQ